MHSLIVDIGRDGLMFAVGHAVSFLFIADEVLLLRSADEQKARNDCSDLRGRNHACTLHSLDSVKSKSTRKVRVRRES